MKFKDGFIKEFEETQAEEEHQAALRKKYNISGEKIVQVKKESILKLIVIGATFLIKWFLIIVGILTLMYPETRESLLTILTDTWDQTTDLLTN